MAQLEAHHLLRRQEVRELRRVARARLDDLLQQERVLAHALDRLQQIAGEIHLVPQLLLLLLGEGI